MYPRVHLVTRQRIRPPRVRRTKRRRHGSRQRPEADQVQEAGRRRGVPTQHPMLDIVRREHRPADPIRHTAEPREPLQRGFRRANDGQRVHDERVVGVDPERQLGFLRGQQREIDGVKGRREVDVRPEPRVPTEPRVVDRRAVRRQVVVEQREQQRPQARRDQHRVLIGFRILVRREVPVQGHPLAKPPKRGPIHRRHVLTPLPLTPPLPHHDHPPVHHLLRPRSLQPRHHRRRRHRPPLPQPPQTHQLVQKSLIVIVVVVVVVVLASEQHGRHARLVRAPAPTESIHHPPQPPVFNQPDRLVRPSDQPTPHEHLRHRPETRLPLQRHQRRRRLGRHIHDGIVKTTRRKRVLDPLTVRTARRGRHGDGRSKGR